jgi:hypothetical protein
VSPSEITFLALGLVLGGAGGAAFLAVARARPGPGHAVRITITPNAISPRLARTLADADGRRIHPTVPGSPEDEAIRDVPVHGASDDVGDAFRPAPPRTRVPSAPAALPTFAVGIPVGRGPAPVGVTGLPAPLAVRVERPMAVAVADRPSASVSGTLTVPRTLPVTLDIGEFLPGLAIRPRPPVAVHLPRLAPAVVAVAVVAEGAEGAEGADRPGAAARGTRPATGPAAGAAPVAADPCADQRRLVTQRCATADTAREAARVSAAALRDAQRAHADLDDSVEAATLVADPRHIASEKDRLHAEFRIAHDRAADHDEAEAAAREWLTEISRLNAAARDALRRVRAGTAELRARAAELEGLTLAANADRIGAETAQGACRDAREAVADCEERQAAARPAPAAEEPGPDDEHWPGGAEPAFDRHPAEPADLSGIPAIVRVLRGDDAAREQLVVSLAGPDRASAPEWHVRIARFVDAVVASAIEAGYLDLADDDPFWHQFSRDERREIVGALAALGYRYDGLSGFADGRVPTQRDLSLAVGYTGLDPMRIRTWPRDQELDDLYARATVAADLWLARQADDLALGRVIDALGPRAGDLADLWDAWGRARPAFLLEV